MKFKRTNREAITINWNPTEGKTSPFQNFVDENNIPVLHRKKNVVVMNNEFYLLEKSWHDFHPNLENGAVLLPLEATI